MSELRVGDHIVVRGETVVIVGFSPMSVVPPIVYLNDPDTGKQLDSVLLEEVERAKRDTARSANDDRRPLTQRRHSVQSAETPTP